MKFKLIIFLLFFVISSIFGRIGEDIDKVKSRFDKPPSQIYSPKENKDICIMFFSNDSSFYIVTFFKNISAFEVIMRYDDKPLDPKDISDLGTLIGEGMEWELLPKELTLTGNLAWVREDGAIVLTYGEWKVSDKLKLKHVITLFSPQMLDEMFKSDHYIKI